jgi:glycosyltransferase involved in cell wall biosynthesis
MDKKLLVISHSYNSFVKDQVNIVSEYFANVTVLVRYNPISEISKIIPSHYLAQNTKASLVDLTDKPSNVSIFTTPVLYLPLDSEYKKLGERHLRAVTEKIQNEKIEFDLIHCHFVWSSGYVGARLKDLHKVPLVVTAHGHDIYDLPFKDAVWRGKIEYVLNSADQITTVSQSNLAFVKKLNVRTPVSVIPNGFRGDQFYPKDRGECRKLLALPDDRVIILTVGNLVEMKGHKYLIEAIAEITKTKKDVISIIVGEGPLRHRLEKQVRESGLGESIKFVGLKSHAEIPIWINACDVLALPSLRESFGVVQIEAMACGKPVIATRNGGSEEIVISEEYGLLCDPGNSKDLADKLLAGLKKEWNGRKISEYAQKFDYGKIKEEFLKTFKPLLS